MYAARNVKTAPLCEWIKRLVKRLFVISKRLEYFDGKVKGSQLIKHPSYKKN